MYNDSHTSSRNRMDGIYYTILATALSAVSILITYIILEYYTLRCIHSTTYYCSGFDWKTIIMTRDDCQMYVVCILVIISYNIILWKTWSKITRVILRRAILRAFRLVYVNLHVFIRLLHSADAVR